jgi:hypothetical protein
MIQQLWRTWASAGLEGTPGLNVYAVSPGLEEMVRAKDDGLDIASSFDLPPGITLATDPFDVPVSFAFTGAAGRRMVARRRYTGLDGRGRWGNYFAHVLTGFPSRYGAREAIRLWFDPPGPDFWREAVGQTAPGVSLPFVALDQLVPGAPDTRVFDEGLFEPIRYAVGAYLSRKPGQRIFVVALPEFVAQLVAALTAALPSMLLTDLTFSLYEAYPLRVSTLLVGTCGAPLLGGAPRRDYRLPPECWREHFVVDDIVGDLAEVPIEPAAEAYAEFAAERLVDPSKRPELDELVVLAERRGVADLAALTDELVALERAYDEASFRAPALGLHLEDTRAAFSLARRPVRDAVIEAATGEWWANQGVHSLRALTRLGAHRRPLAEALETLASEAADEVVRLAGHEFVLDARTLLDAIPAVVWGGKTAHERVLARLTEAVSAGEIAANPSTRVLAIGLGRLAGLTPTNPLLIAHLLGSERDVLEVLGSSATPTEWRAEIVREALRGSPVSETLIKELVASHRGGVRRAVEQLATQAGCELVVIECLRAMAKDGRVESLVGVLESVAGSEAPDVLRSSAARLVFAVDEGRSDDVLLQVLDSVAASASSTIDRAAADPALQALARRYLEQPHLIDGRWNRRLKGRVLGLLSDLPSLPADLRSEAAGLAQMAAAFAAAEQRLPLANILDPLRSALQLRPTLRAELPEDFWRTLAGFARRSDEFDQLCLAAAGDSELDERSWCCRLLRDHAEARAPSPRVVARALVRLLWGIDQTEVRPISDRVAYEAVRAALSGTAASSRKLPLSDIVPIVLDHPGVPRAGDEDAWNLLQELVSAHANQLRLFPDAAHAADLLRAVEKLRMAPQPFVDACWRELDLAAAFAPLVASAAGRVHPLADCLRTLLPPGHPPSARVVVGLLSALGGIRSLEPWVARLISDACEVVALLPPAERRHLVPDQLDEHYERTATFHLFRLLRTEEEAKTLAHTIAGGDQDAYLRLLVIALEARPSGIATTGGVWIDEICRLLGKAGLATRRWLLESPRLRVLAGALETGDQLAAFVRAVAVPQSPGVAKLFNTIVENHVHQRVWSRRQPSPDVLARASALGREYQLLGFEQRALEQHIAEGRARIGGDYRGGEDRARRPGQRSRFR